MGGLSILKALREAMPRERLVYFADSQHNPYGVKPEAFVRERSLAIVQELVREHQIKALVVACNTATAAAIDALRLAHPDLPIVGVEPALKPAALATRTGQVLVLATRGTLHSAKFVQLKAKLEAQHAAAQQALHFHCVPCDGLAERIELLAASGKPWQEAPDLIAMCADFVPASGSFDPKNQAYDTLVLGCTHYPLISALFRARLDQDVLIIDNAGPIAQRAVQLVRGMDAPDEQAPGVTWLSSADAAQLASAARYWGMA